MKHFFTILAALSMLLCLFFVVVTVATLNTSWEIPIGHTDQRTRSIAARYGELCYDDQLKDFDRKGLTRTTEEHLGYEVRKVSWPANPKRGESEATSYQYSMSPGYPIILFAILPIVWVAASLGGRKRKGRVDTDDSNSPEAKSPRRP